MQTVDENNDVTQDAERTAMFADACGSASSIRRQVAENRSVVKDIVNSLLQHEPKFVVTCARGSSDHAATYLKYLVETRLGIVTSSAAPSVQSVYKSSQNLAGALYIAISQSGMSPDLLENVANAKDAGAKVLVMVNDERSPMASMADFLIPLHAGAETSVAATKSYIATLSAILHLAGEWSGNAILNHGLASLPDGLNEAWNLDWQPAVDKFADASNLYVIARGLGLGIAQEAALKLKEVCGIHAEAFSSAEIRHGPMALVKKDFPALVFVQDDETRPGMDRIVSDFLAHGAKALVAGDRYPPGAALPVVTGFHPAIQPILMIHSFYRMCIKLALRRGYDPDRPPNLSKVTRTY